MNKEIILLYKLEYKNIPMLYCSNVGIIMEFFEKHFGNLSKSERQKIRNLKPSEIFSLSNFIKVKLTEFTELIN